MPPRRTMPGWFLSLCFCAPLVFTGAGLAAPPDSPYRDAGAVGRSETPGTARDGASEAGIKSLALKKAVQAMARVIRAWGPEVVNITRTMDGPALRAFRKHAVRIAGRLEDIAEIPDLVTTIVREKTYYFLIAELQLSGGTANVIAQAIEGALYAFL